MVLRQLAVEGWEIKPEDLGVLSPCLTMRINRSEAGGLRVDRIRVDKAPVWAATAGVMAPYPTGKAGSCLAQSPWHWGRGGGGIIGVISNEFGLENRTRAR
jgi:hypothetical protein